MDSGFSLHNDFCDSTVNEDFTQDTGKPQSKDQTLDPSNLTRYTTLLIDLSRLKSAHPRVTLPPWVLRLLRLKSPFMLYHPKNRRWQSTSAYESKVIEARKLHLPTNRRCALGNRVAMLYPKSTPAPKYESQGGGSGWCVGLCDASILRQAAPRRNAGGQ